MDRRTQLRRARSPYGVCRHLAYLSSAKFLCFDSSATWTRRRSLILHALGAPTPCASDVLQATKTLVERLRPLRQA
jgi:hypothetical protein